MSDDARNASARRGKKGLLIGSGVGVVALAAAAYVGACYHYKDAIPEGTTVAGKSIGGMTSEQATRQVLTLKHPNASTKANVTAGDQSFDLAPASAWKPDAEKTLDGVTEFSLSPGRLLDQINGGGEKIEPVYTVDKTALTTLVKKAAESKIDGAPKQGRVKFIGGKVSIVDGAPGHGVDEKKVADAIASGWPKKTDYTTELVEKNSDASDNAVQAFAEGDAKKAMSAPLEVSANGQSVTLTPAQVSDVISSTTGADGKPAIKVDTKALLTTVLSRGDKMRVPAVDAKVVWKDGQPSVVEGRSGKEIDESKVAKIVGDALVGDHKATLAMKEQKPAVMAKDVNVEALPSTSMAHFESPFPTGPSQQARIHNITTAINRLNGIVVQPGEQFSLLRALGYEFTKESGYVEAGTLQGGLHLDGMGGGVSQVSTTMYNTAFFAGVQLDEHTAHAVYISRYPMGREATIWNPGIDNKWTNDTGKPILIKAHVESNKVVMDFYGTKKYDVATRTSGKYNIQPPKHRTVKNVKGCENTVGGGVPGFDVDVYRELKSGSTTVRTEKIHTKYKPDDIITCQN